MNQKNGLWVWRLGGRFGWSVVVRSRRKPLAHHHGHNGGDGAVLEFLRGGGGGEDYASFVGESLGDKLSAAAALLVPPLFDATVDLDRARSIVLDYQLVPDASMGGDAQRGFFTALPRGGASFLRPRPGALATRPRSQLGRRA